jgi:hypothetical protein
MGVINESFLYDFFFNSLVLPKVYKHMISETQKLVQKIAQNAKWMSQAVSTKQSHVCVRLWTDSAKFRCGYRY